MSILSIIGIVLGVLILIAGAIVVTMFFMFSLTRSPGFLIMLIIGFLASLGQPSRRRR